MTAARIAQGNGRKRSRLIVLAVVAVLAAGGILPSNVLVAPGNDLDPCRL